MSAARRLIDLARLTEDVRKDIIEGRWGFV